MMSWCCYVISQSKYTLHKIVYLMHTLYSFAFTRVILIVWLCLIREGEVYLLVIIVKGCLLLIFVKEVNFYSRYGDQLFHCIDRIAPLFR